MITQSQQHEDLTAPRPELTGADRLQKATEGLCHAKAAKGYQQALIQH